MKKSFFRILLFVAIVCFSERVWAQLTQYNIGGPGNELATRVRRNSTDSSVFICGYTYDYTGGVVSNCQAILMKIGSTGSIVWQRTFGIPSRNNLIQDMILTQDGNVVVVGTVGGTGAVFSNNTAAILKFNGATGSLMWQNCFRDAVTTVGGEIFFGVTELTDGTGRLVAVGAHNYTGYGAGSMICVFQSNGTLIYNEVLDVTNGDEFQCVIPSAAGNSVYICGEFVGDYKDGRVISYTPGTTSGTVNWASFFDYYVQGIYQDNFFASMFLSGGKLVISSGNLETYSVAYGCAHAVITLNAADGSGGQVYGIQNSGALYANAPHIAVVSSDHIFTVQTPSSTNYDPMLWLAGVSTDAVVTEITSLSSGTYNPPVKFSSSVVGQHGINDIRLYGSTLYLAGATNLTTGFGNNDIYLIVSGTSFSSTNHTCDTTHETMSITTPTFTVNTPTYTDYSFVTTPATVDTGTTSFNIHLICGDSASAPVFCNSLSVLPGFTACVGTIDTLHANVFGGDSIVKIAWSPGYGLSDSTVLNPALTVNPSSSWYYCTVASVLPGNLVVNGDFSAGNTGFTSGYTIEAPSASSAPAHYAVDVNPHLYDAGWATFGDHTTGAGNMLIVDGSSSPTASFWCETIPVSSFTDYNLSVWYQLLLASNPNVQVKINGVVVGAFVPDTGIWKQSNMQWNSGAATSATICMYDLNSNAAGNDFAIDDIAFQKLCIAKDSIHVLVIVPDSIKKSMDTTLCVMESAVPFSASSGYTSYLWNTGATTSGINISCTGTYWVDEFSSGTCSFESDTFHVTIATIPIVELGDDTTICTGDTILLSPTLMAGATFTWSTGAATSAIHIFNAGSYWLIVNNHGCIASDSLTLTVNPLPIVNLGPDDTICQGSSINLQLSGGSAGSYLWSTGSTYSTISVTDSGKYWVWITLGGCANSDTVAVFEKPTPVMNLGNDTGICAGASITIGNVVSGNVSYQWSNGATEPVITVSSAGTYSVIVTEDGCMATASIHIDVVTPPKIDLGIDTNLCVGDVFVLPIGNKNDTSGTMTFLWNDGSNGTNFSVTETGKYWVTVSNQCGVATDTVNIYYDFCDIWFPTAFSPNGDGYNDIIRVRGALHDYTDFSLSIYNRWGQRVFYTEDIYAGWDGRFNGVAQELDTYMYMIFFKLRGKKGFMKGDFQLIR